MTVDPWDIIGWACVGSLGLLVVWIVVGWTWRIGAYLLLGSPAERRRRRLARYLGDDGGET